MSAVMVQTIAGSFIARYEYYRGTGSWSNVGDEVEDLFRKLAKLDFVIGSVRTGKCGDEKKCDYILITTETGKFMLYRQPNNRIRYFCEKSFTTCVPAKENGFDKISGEIDDSEQLDYIFAIADQYQ